MATTTGFPQFTKRDHVAELTTNQEQTAGNDTEDATPDTATTLLA